MQSNFLFLEAYFRDLYNKMLKAEQRVYAEPVSTAGYCRLVLEEVIHKIYQLEYLEYPYNTDLVNLMNNEEVKRIIPYMQYNGMHLVRKTGNNAAHYGKRVNKEDALQSIKYPYAGADLQSVPPSRKQPFGCSLFFGGYY